MSVPFLTSYVLLWALVIFQGVLTLALLMKLRELHNLAQAGITSDDLLQIGSDAPQFSGIEVYSGRVIERHQLDKRGVLILFLSPHCSQCSRLVSTMAPSSVSKLPPIVCFCRGSEQACARFAARFQLKASQLVSGAERVASEYRSFMAPTAVFVDGDGRIRAYAHPKRISELIALLHENHSVKLSTEPFVGSRSASAME